MSHILREVKADISGTIAAKVAILQEFTEGERTFLYYTVGADLGPKIDEYDGKGLTLLDPEQAKDLYQIGLPVHRREVVKRDKGPNPDQALADADGENEFPRFMADAPVAYTRQADGQNWLVFQRGPHMRQALDELWRLGKAVSNIEVLCTDPDGAPLLFRGKRCFRRLVVSKDSKSAVKPDTIT